MRAVLIAIFLSLLCGRACAHFTPPAPWTDDARAFTTPQDAATHQVTAGVTLLSSFAFGYDAVSNLRQSVETVAAGAISVAGRTVLNAYDRTHRLQVETASEPARTVQTTYGYDAANNRTAKGVVTTAGGGAPTAESHSYVYGAATNGRNSNQLYTWTKPGGSVATYGYDANGNRASQTTGGGGSTSQEQLGYDYFNRLVQVVQTPNTGSPAAIQTHQYGYDHRTRRVTRSEQAAVGGALAAATVSFSGGTSVLEFVGGSSPVVEYVRGSDWGGGVGGIHQSR